jgi:FAD synthase
MFILSQREKIELLSKAGVDHLIIVKFTLEFSKVSSLDFIKKYLVEKLHASILLLGLTTILDTIVRVITRVETVKFAVWI